MNTLRTVVTALLIVSSATSFTQSIPSLRRHATPPLFYKEEDETSSVEIPQRAPILPRVEEKVELTFPQPPAPDLQPPKLVLPSTLNEETKQSTFSASIFIWTDKIRKRFQTWNNRPGVRFRMRLGTITAAALAVTSLIVPHGSTKLLRLAKKWISHRGFQGIAALGRSFTYIWAVLVAYPRMLDRRSADRNRQRKDQALERRRAQLNQLSTEVSRLQQELSGLDAEIRAFRREIISLKAYAKEDSEEVQKAINQEMGHLTQLRSDAKAALAAARQSWAEYRSMSPPEIWNDTLVP